MHYGNFFECVYGVLFSSLWLKSEPGWPAISVGTSQQFHVGRIVWFGCLSTISQLASRVGGGGGVWQLCLHSVTQPYTTWPRWREQVGGLRSLPLTSTGSNFNLNSCLCVYHDHLRSDVVVYCNSLALLLFFLVKNIKMQARPLD
jgi:hypothetical protein